MKILLVFATNSSGTYQAAELIRETLLADRHQVKFQAAKNTQPNDLQGHDLIILGSCTWERIEQGHRLEGQLQEQMHALALKLHAHPMPQQSFAVFALGDQSYTDFCQAADLLEDVVRDLQGRLVAPALRIDRWFFNLVANRQAVQTWARQLGAGHAPTSKRRRKS